MTIDHVTRDVTTVASCDQIRKDVKLQYKESLNLLTGLTRGSANALRQERCIVEHDSVEYLLKHISMLLNIPVSINSTKISHCMVTWRQEIVPKLINYQKGISCQPILQQNYAIVLYSRHIYLAMVKICQLLLKRQRTRVARLSKRVVVHSKHGWTQ